LFLTHPGELVMSISVPRAAYQSSGRVRWSVFLPLALAVLVSAVAMAWVLAFAFRLGFYLVIVAPLIAGGLVGIVLNMAVSLGHCRNRYVAAAVGILAGGLLYLGYYQFDLARFIGMNNVQRVDFLPRYVWFRLQHDQIRPVHGVGAGAVRENTIVDRCFNGVFFLLELGMACGIPLGIGWKRSQRTYSEAHESWLDSHSIHCSPESGIALVQALQQQDLAGFTAALAPANSPAVDHHAELTIEYLRGEADSPVYLSAALVRPPIKKGKLPTREMLAQHWELTNAESGALAGTFDIPGAAFGSGASRAPAADESALLSGRVIALPVDPEQRVLSRRNHWRVLPLALSPLVLGIGGGIGLFAYAYLSQGDNLDWMLGIPCFLGGFALMFGSLVYMACYGDYLPSRFFYRRSLAAIRERPDAVVDTDDPDAVYIQVIPRAHWGKVMMENATEIGLLKIDEQRDALLYEGDCERWVIPGGSVRSCDIEEFAIGDPAQGTTFPMVVVRATVDGRAWEAPIALRHIRFTRRTAAVRQQWAIELAARVARLLPPEE
jgi:hypothetical protein